MSKQSNRSMEDFTGSFLDEKNSEAKKRIPASMSIEDSEMLKGALSEAKTAGVKLDIELISGDDIIKRQLKHLHIMERLHQALIIKEGENLTMRPIQLSKYIIDSYGRVYDQMKGKTVNVNTTQTKKWEDDPYMQKIQKEVSEYVEKLKKDGRINGKP